VCRVPTATSLLSKTQGICNIYFFPPGWVLPGSCPGPAVLPGSSPAHFGSKWRLRCRMRLGPLAATCVLWDLSRAQSCMGHGILPVRPPAGSRGTSSFQWGARGGGLAWELACEDLPLLLHISAAAEQGSRASQERVTKKVYASRLRSWLNLAHLFVPGSAFRSELNSVTDWRRLRET
jgi:hypothetical protein